MKLLPIILLLFTINLQAGEQHYNDCVSQDTRGWLNFIPPGEPDFSPTPPHVLAGPHIQETCSPVWYGFLLEIGSRVGYANIGEHSLAGYYDRSTAAVGFAALGDYEAAGFYSPSGYVLSGEPYVVIRYEAECDCIKANRPVVWD